MKTPNKGCQDARGEQGVNVVNKMGAKEGDGKVRFKETPREDIEFF